MELSVPVGLGAFELNHAIRVQAQRILTQSKGDVLAQTAVLYEMLVERGLLTKDELATLTSLAELSARPVAEDGTAHAAFLQAREVHATVVAGGTAGPVAMALASSSIGGYEVTGNPDGSGVVVYAKNTGEWEKRGAALGALIGADWGTGGAAIGGLIGGAIGSAVDHCLK